MFAGMIASAKRDAVTAGRRFDAATTEAARRRNFAKYGEATGRLLRLQTLTAGTSEAALVAEALKAAATRKG